MQGAAILKILGLLLMIFSVTLLPPIGVSLWAGDGEAPHFFYALLSELTVGLVLWLPVRRHRGDLRVRDGFIVVALFWTVLSLVGALPFLFGPHLSFTEAMFEAVSGFTTTGATVLIGLDELPRSILYYRQQLQWLGGMGIIVLAVAILPILGVGGMQLYRAETPGPMKETKLTPRITHTARALWYIYLGLTLACALAYWLAGMGVFDAVTHAFTTIATGGFSTHDASLAYFDSGLIEAIAIVFMILGALNFALHFYAWQALDPRRYLQDPEARAFLGILVAVTVIVALTLYATGESDTAEASLRAALFQVTAVLTTTGYTTADFADWPLFLPFLIITLSFIGGCAGSTAAGMKVIRTLLLYKQGMREIFRLVHPNASLPIKVGRNVMSDRVIDSVWGFFSLYIMSTVVLTLVMLGVSGLDPVSSFAAAVASLNVLGPGLGEVADTFATVTDAGKWVAIFAMLLGRLELFTLFVLLSPTFWRR